MKLIILIPCKHLGRGKSRLASCLTQRSRRALCDFFLRRTLAVAIAAAGRAHVRVVTGDPDAARIAAAHRVGVIFDGGSGGLNRALERARKRLRQDDRACGALILPIDLPLATPPALARIIAMPGAAVIVPDRGEAIGAGTNVLRLEGAAWRDFAFCYGTQSYERHCAAARRIGFALLRIEDPGLMFDIDSPQQFTRWAPRDPGWLARAKARRSSACAAR